MKVAMIGFTNVKYMPYMNGYLQAEEQASLDLIYWKRDRTPDEGIPSRISNVFCFDELMSDEQPMCVKLPHFLRYRRFVLKTLRSNRYDRLIVMHSTPGLTILDYLLKYYRDAYILDYRDLSHENLRFYRHLIAKLVNGSHTTFISSDAFREYLPQTSKIRTTHNLLPDALAHREVRRAKSRKTDVIRIRFWGLIRHLEANTRLILLLGNDKRFELHYHGRDQGTGAVLQKLCESKGITNVFFHGEYRPEERYGFAGETDIIDNIYNNDLVVRNAIGNKYYDAVALYLPQICVEGSYMARLVAEKHLGIVICFGEAQVVERILAYYNGLDWERFEHACDEELQKIAKQNRVNADIIINFLSSIR